MTRGPWNSINFTHDQAWTVLIALRELQDLQVHADYDVDLVVEELEQLIDPKEEGEFYDA